MSYGRMSRFPSYNIAKIAAVIITFIVIIVVMIESVVIVEAGHRGVVLYLGAVENRVLGEGLHFIVPFAEQVIQMEVRTQKIPSWGICCFQRFTGSSYRHSIKLLD